MKALNFKHFLLFVYLLINLISFTSANNNVKPHCENVRKLFANEGLGLNNKPDLGNLRICRSYKGSCCTKSIESQLNVKSKSDFQQKFKQLINNSMESSLNSWGEHFNKYYLDAISLGQDEFDLMFRKLYGSRYEENYEIFNELFKKFQAYHEKGEVDLEQAMNSFFEQLFVRLFKMLNPNFQFQPDYIRCLTENMKVVEPFGEVPKDLIMNLKRQLGASRTFVQGFKAAANIINQLNQIDIGSICAVELMQINYCSHCSGHINLKPCKLNCEWAYSKCVVYYQDFEVAWNTYLNTIIQFRNRLTNQLSLENTLGSLNYKISDVIMHFQENKVAITNKVFEKCSKIKNVNKRSVKETDDEDGVDLLSPDKFKEMRSKNKEIGERWKNLEIEVKKKIRNLKSYWSKLPKAVCKKLNPTSKCWNGTNSIDLNKQIKPSFDLRIPKTSRIYQLIDIQKNRLQIVNSKLISSYNGNGLEKFDFDTQASFSIGITTEPDEPDDSDDPDDSEEDDESKNKNREFDQHAIQDEPIEQNEQLSQNDQEKDESNLKDVRNQPDVNNLENDVDNVYPPGPQTIDKPKDLGLTNNSMSTSISLTMFIIFLHLPVLTRFNTF